MPSTSKKQRNFMAAAAHNPAFAKKAGISMDVAKEFNQADKGHKFSKGGTMKEESKAEMRKEMAEDKKQDVALISKAFKQHDKQEHKGSKGTTLKLSKGGSFRSAADGITKTGKTKGRMISMCGGGSAMSKKAK